jgi:hypothetical protein
LDIYGFVSSKVDSVSFHHTTFAISQMLIVFFFEKEEDE